MTLIAAIRCTEGIVVCGDSEENRGGYRRSVQKISPRSMGNFEVIVGGSGIGDLIDAFILRLENTVSKSSAKSIPELKSLIEDQVCEFYALDAASYPTDKQEDKHIKCIIGARSITDCSYEAWVTKHVVLSPVTTYELAGIEDVIYDHVIRRLCTAGMTLAQGVLAAAYVFTIAKETSTYIRGDTSISVIRENGITLEDSAYVHDVEERLRQYEGHLNKIFLACADTSISPFTLKTILATFSLQVEALHTVHLDNTVQRILDAGLNGVDDPYPRIPSGTVVTLPEEGLRARSTITYSDVERAMRMLEDSLRQLAEFKRRYPEPSGEQQ